MSVVETATYETENHSYRVEMEASGEMFFFRDNALIPEPRDIPAIVRFALIDGLKEKSHEA